MDVMKSGTEQIVMEEGPFRAVIAPERGGRLLELSCDGQNALHTLYPDSFTFGPYTEYGGMEEHVGSAPGVVWNVPWEVESQNGSVSLAVFSNKTLVRKKFQIEDGPLLRIEYELTNYSTNFARFTFGIHPELAIGGDHRTSKFHIPLDGRVESGGYSGAGFRKYVVPEEGWSAATAGDRLFMQALPPGVTDCLEIYYPKVDTHLVLQPVVFGVGLSPERTVRFPYLLYFGPGDVSTAQEIYANALPTLTPMYEAAGPQPDLQRPERRDHKHQPDFGFEGEVEKAMRREEKNLHRGPRFEPHRGPHPRPEPNIVHGPQPHIAHGPHRIDPHAPRPDFKEERLAVLEGVSADRISVEDAIRLLEKLEGR